MRLSSYIQRQWAGVPTLKKKRRKRNTDGSKATRWERMKGDQAEELMKQMRGSKVIKERGVER